jgi:glycosyltransferase involved in cell wall biosynthesis
MKILFDLSAAQPDNEIINHGGSEYAKAVFLKLAETCPESVSVFFDRNLAMDRSILEIIKKHSIKTLESSDLVTVSSFIEDNEISVFYSALPKSQHLPLFETQSKTFKVVITIHGLRSLELPSDSYERYYSRSAKSRIKIIYKQMFPSVYKNTYLKHYRKFLGASRIITVSDHSKEALLKFFPEIDSNKINVYYSPLINYKTEDYSPVSVKSSLTLIPRKYFILLSGSIWTKNGYRAIKAFDELISGNREIRDYKMLVTGVNQTFFKVKNPENFVFSGYLNRNILEEQLKNALALVYPTLNEGFGYPPLEAMKYGVPVLGSAIGPVMEVCGDAAEYFNPHNEDEIKSCLLRATDKNISFSESNINTRYDRYHIIRARQENDLEKMIRLLTGNAGNNNS